MANLVYNTAKLEIMNGTIDLNTDVLKVMLVTALYVANADDDVVDAGGANDAVDHELTGAGYVPGFGGTGRLTLVNKVATVDKPNDRAELDADDLVWLGINAGIAAAAIIIKEAGADDTATRLIGYMDQGGFPITTNTGPFNLTWGADGLLHLT